VTFIILIFFIVFYSLVNIQYFSTNWIDPFGDSCKQSFEACFFYTLDLGLRNGGGVGESLQILDYES
jgi:hypothetical protein